MSIAVYLSMLAPAAAWLLGLSGVGPFLADQLRPALATALLAAAGVVLAGTSSLAACLLVALGLSRWDPSAARSHWALAREVPASHPAVLLEAVTVLAVAGAVLLAVSTMRVVRALVSAAGQYASARAMVPRRLAAGSVVQRRDVAATARALPVRGGHVLVDVEQWTAMDGTRRGIVLAHERSHLRHRHDLYLLAGAVSAAANPLLTPIAEAITYAVERWADEDAARECGDRPLVARAIASVALENLGRPAAALAVGGGVVPRRVAALLGPGRVAISSARGAFAAGLLVVVPAGAVGVLLHAWSDLLEILSPR